MATQNHFKVMPNEDWSTHSIVSDNCSTLGWHGSVVVRTYIVLYSVRCLSKQLWNAGSIYWQIVFEILSFWNAMFIFLPRELDFSCKLFCGVLDSKISKIPLYFTPASISDKIVETLSSKGVILENETIHTPSPCPPFKTRVLLFSTGSSNSSTTFHGWLEIDGKLYFLLFKLANC